MTNYSIRARKIFKVYKFKRVNYIISDSYPTSTKGVRRKNRNNINSICTRLINLL